MPWPSDLLVRENAAKAIRDPIKVHIQNAMPLYRRTEPAIGNSFMRPFPGA